MLTWSVADFIYKVSFIRENNMKKIYHCTSWNVPVNANPGDQFTLVPGRQNAQGVGVYFSEGTLRVSAAEGARGATAIVAVSLVPQEGTWSADWFRSKNGVDRKQGTTKTWHSLGKSVTCIVTGISELQGIRVLECQYRLI